MSEFSNTLSVTTSALGLQAKRLRLISENIANADTAGFRRKTAPVLPQRGADAAPGQVRLGPVRLDQAPLQQVHDPSHPLADAAGYYQGSNVDLMLEIADSREAQRSYEANLKIFDQTRQMSSSLMDLLRR